MSLDNPAGRLLAQFQLVHSRPNGESAYVAWCGAWGLDQSTWSDKVEFMRRAEEMMRLGIELEEEANLLPSKLVGANIARVVQVRRVLDHFPVAPNVQISQMMSPLQADGQLALENIDNLLSEMRARPVLLERDRDPLLEQVRHLIDEVIRNDDFSELVKREIVDHLRDVEQKLIDTSIVGAVPLERSTNGLLGVFIALHLRGERIANHKLTRAVFGLVLAIDLALNGAANYRELTTNDPVVAELVGDPAALLPQLPNQSSEERPGSE